MHDAVAEAEEQRRQVQVSKKKSQRLTAEMQDLKLHLEEQMSRNNELERKQRRLVVFPVGDHAGELKLIELCWIELFIP